MTCALLPRLVAFAMPLPGRSAVQLSADPPAHTPRIYELVGILLAGVPTPRHADVSEPLTADIDEKAEGTGRSCVSRR